MGAAVAEPLPAFVKRRRPEWELLSKHLHDLAAKRLTLAQLSDLDRLYRRAAADLAHAQVVYQGTDAVRFLNQLCARAYGTIYRRRESRLGAAKEFFAATYPRAVRAELRYVALAAILMGLGALCGALAVAVDPAAADLLVPDSIQAIVANRRLWTDELLSQAAPNELALAILTHNLVVTAGAFALGVTMGLGTVAVLLINGLHIGSVLCFCFQRGLGWPLLSFMSAHGPVELSVIAIAGGAGLMVGHALLEPGELPRADALKTRSLMAVKLVLGAAPALVAIGLIEGFVSPGRLFAWPVKLLVGVLLGAGFWVYALRAGRSGASR